MTATGGTVVADDGAHGTPSSLFGFTTVAHGVNLAKGLTLPLLVTLLLFTNNQTYTARVYTALHGLYGILWVLKQVYFPDKNFMKRPSEVISFNLGIDLDVSSPLVEFFLNLLLFAGVCSYWLGGSSLILSELVYGEFYECGPTRVALAVASYGLGVFLHFGADIQKHERLQFKKGLITDGFYSICRSPGYLGEILIYGGFFALCPLDWPLFVSIAVMVSGMPTFLVGKERSISRHPEYAEYSKRVKLLIPFIF